MQQKAATQEFECPCSNVCLSCWGKPYLDLLSGGESMQEVLPFHLDLLEPVVQRDALR
jgi:hypothetical protein